MTERQSEVSNAVEVQNLDVVYRVYGEDRQAVRGLDFTIELGKSYGLVGESGCGKSTVALALVRVLPPNGRVTRGSVYVAGQDILGARGETLRRMRSDVVAMVYQDPAKALNPSIRVGKQIAEAYVVRGDTWKAGHLRARQMLGSVQIADPDLVMRRYPHELSGGMQQRVVIAMALAKSPQLLILDEPTTGLDATVEAEVLDLIETLRKEFQTSVLFISHNLKIVARMCDRVGVMYAGRLVEEGATDEIFGQPKHPYTASLLGCIPHAGMNKDRGPLVSIPGGLPSTGEQPQGCVFAERCPVGDKHCHEIEPGMDASESHRFRCFYPERTANIGAFEAAEAGTSPNKGAALRLLTAEKVSKTFRQGQHEIRVLTDVSLNLGEAETLGIVGESGSGKSTLARVLLGLIQPDAGSTLTLGERPLRGRAQDRDLDQVRSMQIVFQNPDSALNRRHSVRRILKRALHRFQALSREQREQRVVDLADQVRLPTRHLGTRPASLSGGMKQRVAIARAFSGEPRIVVCDEPTSALDVSVQAAILNLFVRLQRDQGTSYIFISHDLAIVRYIADRIMVMYLGRIMEVAGANELFSPPYHPYTEALLSTGGNGIANGPTERVRLHGEPPSVAEQPSGCVFHTRCPRKLGAVCETEDPEPQVLASGRTIRCHIPVDELRHIQAATPNIDSDQQVKEMVSTINWKPRR